MSTATVWARWRGASDPLRFLVVIVLWLLLALFVLYPLIELIRRALSDDAGFTLAPLIAALHSKSNLRAFGNSLLLATLVGICGTILGFLFAFTVERTTAPKFWMRLLDIATLLPLISPPFTTSIAFVFSFGPRGFITHDLLGLNNATVYGLPSTLAAETLTYFPLAYMAAM
jgi:iron(III) transport system permease protein